MEKDRADGGNRLVQCVRCCIDPQGNVIADRLNRKIAKRYCWVLQTWHPSYCRVLLAPGTLWRSVSIEPIAIGADT